MHEHQTVEWKESWHDEYLEWVCGYANAQGGVIIIGKDKNGIPVGVANAAKLLEDIPNKIEKQVTFSSLTRNERIMSEIMIELPIEHGSEEIT